MPNATGFLSRFRRQPGVAPPRGNALVAQAALINEANPNNKLANNVKAYVDGYLRNRNNSAKVPPLNMKMANALHTYINTKRARVAGAAAAGAANEGAPPPVQNAAAVVAGNVPPSAPPSNVATQTANAVRQAGGNVRQANSAATAAAAQHTANQGRTPNQVANQAANAAVRTAPTNASPANVANTAATAAAAAVPPGNAPVAAANAAANAARKQALNQGQTTNQANTAAVNAAVKAVNNTAPRNLGVNTAGRIAANAVRNAGGNPNAVATAGTRAANNQAENKGVAPPPPPPPLPPRVPIIRQGGRVTKLPTPANLEAARKGINFNELKRRVAQRQARVAAAASAPKNNSIEEIQGGPRNNKYGNNKRTNKSRAMSTDALLFQLGSRSMNARSPPYIAEALARLKNGSTSSNNKASLVKSLSNARNRYRVPNLTIPQVN